MTNTPYQAYRDSQLMNSSPERLVQLLYEAALRTIKAAREYNRQNDVLNRGKQCTKAFEIFVELQGGLDFERGGELAKNYGRLYDYCQRRLLEAHARQSDALLAEVQSLVEDLCEAWRVVVEQTSQTGSADAQTGSNAYGTLAAGASEGRPSLVGMA